MIRSSRFKGPRKPLVLQNELSKELIYTNDKWTRNIAVPYADKAALSERTLPAIGVKYPYLTVSDILEPYLLQVPYPINDSKFFDGNLESREVDDGFLLPIKPLFFQFLDPGDLQGLTESGFKKFEMKKLGPGGVKVTLKIPIKKDREYIVFERLYYPVESDHELPAVDEEGNKGYIVKASVSVSILPLIKLRPPTTGHYRIMLVDRGDPMRQDARLEFYDSRASSPSERLTNIPARQRGSKGDDVLMTFYVLEDKSFESIQAQLSPQMQGMIIPKFVLVDQGTSPYSFAIDFGTTNTHIEYLADQVGPQPFEINESDMQLATLYKTGFDLLVKPELVTLPPRELIPETINHKSTASFPQRTVIGQNMTVDVSKPTFALADYMLPFMYGKDKSAGYTDTSTNLKWSNYSSDKDSYRRVEMFLEELMFLIRNKILMNRGSLDKTTLIGFYPSSMVAHKRLRLEEAWAECIKKYISTSVSLKTLSESLAPFYYYVSKENVMNSDRPAIAIDIGGGTTDIVIFEKDVPKALSSFKFAANSIFGDGYNGSIANNGFVSKYYDNIDRCLASNNLTRLNQVHDEIRRRDKSEDLVSFWFSLESNKVITDKKIPINFSKDLTNDEQLRTVFFMFIASIFYHIASLMKSLDLKTPGYITFSGTGSKILSYVGDNQELDRLATFSTRVFEHVYGSRIDRSIKLKRAEQPKEITCKGGLSLKAGGAKDIEDIKVVYVGGGQVSKQGSLLKYEAINREPEVYLNRVGEDIDRFWACLEDINNPSSGSVLKAFNLKNNLGVSLKKELKDICFDEYREFVHLGLVARMEEMDNNASEEIAEPLFFYPLVGGLNRLAYNLIQKKQG